LNKFQAPVKAAGKNSVILTPRPNAEIYFTRVSPLLSKGSATGKSSVPI